MVINVANTSPHEIKVVLHYFNTLVANNKKHLMHSMRDATDTLIDWPARFVLIALKYFHRSTCSCNSWQLSQSGCFHRRDVGSHGLYEPIIVLLHEFLHVYFTSNLTLVKCMISWLTTALSFTTLIFENEIHQSMIPYLINLFSLISDLIQ